LPNVSGEALVSDEGRVARGTIELLHRLIRIDKEIFYVDHRPGCAATGNDRGCLALLYPSRILMVQKELAVTTRWIQ
jgi:hypothetical protein